MKGNSIKIPFKPLVIKDSINVGYSILLLQVIDDIAHETRVCEFGKKHQVVSPASLVGRLTLLITEFRIS